MGGFKTPDSTSLTPNIPNLTASGDKVLVTIGESVVFGDELYLNGSDSRYYKVKATADSTMPGSVLALGTYSAGNYKQVLIRGYIRNDTWSYYPGQKLYTDVLSGKFTQLTPPNDFQQTIGSAFTSSTIFFNPELTYDRNYTLSQHDIDITALFKQQTFSMQYTIERRGKYYMARAGKHPRLKIINAFATIGDNIPGLEQTIQLEGMSQPLKFKGTEKAGKIQLIEITKDIVPFWVDIKVIATTDRRVTVTLHVESDHPTWNY